jgi:hypothetical protein
LASKVLFDTRGFYNDSKLKNAGPIPLQIGKETTFTLHWSITNVSNDLAGAKVIASLPTGVRWVGSVYPTDASLAYNPRTNQLVWDAGNVDAGAGVLSPVKEVLFQVGVTPQVNQLGQSLVLLNKSIFSATDNFINKDITLSADQKDTQLLEDPAVGFNNGKVAN